MFQRIRNWRYGRKFWKRGKGCLFLGKHLEIDGKVAVGKECTFGGNLVLRTHKRGEIHIGNRVHVGDYVLIQCNDRIEIGDDCYVGAYCVLRDTNHLFHGTDIHWRLTPHITKPIVLESGVYLAPRCYVMPGVRIGTGAAVAPGSVITRDVGAYEIWAGNPAVFVANRRGEVAKNTLRRHLELAHFFGVPLPTDNPSQ